MVILGGLATFLPQEILDYFDSHPDGLVLLIVQIMGALYMGFAILNWMARSSIVGGIYNRPIALGNFLHFTMVALVLLRALMVEQRIEIIVAAVVYSAFTIWFGLATFTNPIKGKKS